MKFVMPSEPQLIVYSFQVQMAAWPIKLTLMQLQEEKKTGMTHSFS